MASKNLTLKQQKFVQEYLITGSASKAYKLAYNTSNMKPTTINRKAKECLDHGKITARIKQIRSAKISKRFQFIVGFYLFHIVYLVAGSYHYGFKSS